MTKDQIKARIAELKYDYIRIQEDIEKMESTGGSMTNAERQLQAIEDELKLLHQQQWSIIKLYPPCLIQSTLQIFELIVKHSIIGALFVDQTVMAALLYNLTMIDNCDRIRIANGVQTVGNDKAGAPLHDT